MRPKLPKNAPKKRSEKVSQKSDQKVSQKAPKLDPKTAQKGEKKNENCENTFLSKSKKWIFSFFRVENAPEKRPQNKKKQESHKNSEIDYPYNVSAWFLSQKSGQN